MISNGGKRTACVERQTGETHVRLRLNQANQEEAQIATGAGFLDHLIGAVAKRAGWVLEVLVDGDTARTGAHHVAEDVGLALGEAIRAMLWEATRAPMAAAAPGVARFGEALTPMDEALVLVAIDLSGRPLCRAHGFEHLRVSSGESGEFTGQDWIAFCGGLALGGLLTLHQRVIDGDDDHHILEAAAKGLGRALGQACQQLPGAMAGEDGELALTSTKGQVRLEVKS